MADHHFVARGFLRGFAADPERKKIWVYDKRPERRPGFRSIKSIAWLPDYYSQEREDGTLDHSVEEALGKTVDNSAPRIINRISAQPGDRVTLSKDERAEMAFFVALSLTRVPSFRDGIDEMHEHLGEILLSRVAEQDPDIARGVEKYGARAMAKPQGSLEPMLSTARDIAHSLIPKAWQFFVPPPDEPLATSDNPVIFSGRYAELRSFGPAHPLVEVVMNLRSDLALVCTPRDMSTDLTVSRLSKFDSRKFTRGIVQAARHRVFFRLKSDTFDEFVKKYPDEGQRLRGR